MCAKGGNSPSDSHFSRSVEQVLVAGLVSRETSKAGNVSKTLRDSSKCKLLLLLT